MTDLVALYDVDPAAPEMTSPLGELYQDLLHRLFEPPGSNLDDPDRGVGIEDMLSGGFDATVGPSQAVSRRIETDFLKDVRVQACRADVTPDANSDGGHLVTIQVKCNEGLLGIVLAASGTGVVVVSLPPGAT